MAFWFGLDFDRKLLGGAIRTEEESFAVVSL